jgi:hypothetical protein
VPDALDLQTLCDAVLAAATAALDTIPGFDPALEGAPDRTFTGAGQPVFDCCPALSVNASTIREAPTEPLGLAAGTRHRQNFRKNLVAVQVWITRCSANGEAGQPPTVAALTAVSEQVNADGWALWNYMWNINRSGSSDPIVSLCDEWYMDSLIPLQPSGGCSGWQLNIRAELAGYGDGTDP